LALKKQNFAEGEIAIFDEACVYKRGEYWQFRLWLPKENKYARKSLRTRSESEFSKDWLCRSECYMRTLRFKRVKPSVGTLGYMRK
jgi:hypothetical protein